MVRKTNLVVENNGDFLLIILIKQHVMQTQEIWHEFRIINIESDKYDNSI